MQLAVTWNTRPTAPKKKRAKSRSVKYLTSRLDFGGQSAVFDNIDHHILKDALCTNQTHSLSNVIEMPKRSRRAAHFLPFYRKLPEASLSSHENERPFTSPARNQCYVWLALPWRPRMKALNKLLLLGEAVLSAQRRIHIHGSQSTWSLLKHSSTHQSFLLPASFGCWDVRPSARKAWNEKIRCQ